MYVVCLGIFLPFHFHDKRHSTPQLGMDQLPKKAQPLPSPTPTDIVGGEKESMVVWPPVCESVTHAVTAHNGVTEKRPPLSRTFHFRRAFYFYCLWGFFSSGGWRESVVVFQAGRTSLPTQRGFRGECGKRLCGSPKINNEPSYTTRLSSLDVNGKSGGQRSIGTEAAAAAVGGGGGGGGGGWRGLNRCISRITNYALVVIFEGERRFDRY